MLIEIGRSQLHNRAARAGHGRGRYAVRAHQKAVRTEEGDVGLKRARQTAGLAYLFLCEKTREKCEGELGHEGIPVNITGQDPGGLAHWRKAEWALGRRRRGTCRMKCA